MVTPGIRAMWEANIAKVKQNRSSGGAVRISNGPKCRQNRVWAYRVSPSLLINRSTPPTATVGGGHKVTVVESGIGLNGLYEHAP